MGLRERKKAATRHRIVDVALHRFAEHGYHATTVEEIAADAEVSVTTFFRYFRAKDEILFVDADRRSPDFRSALLARPPDEPDLVAIHRALRTFSVREGYEDDPKRRLRQHQVITETPVLRGRAHEVAEHWQEEVATGLAQRRGTSADDFDLRLAAAIAFAIVSFADDEWCAHKGAIDWLTCLDDAFNHHATLTPGERGTVR